MNWEHDDQHRTWKRYGDIEMNMRRCVSRRAGGGTGWKEYDVTYVFEGKHIVQTIQAASPADAEEFIMECFQRRFACSREKVPIMLKGTVEYHGKHAWE